MNLPYLSDAVGAVYHRINPTKLIATAALGLTLVACNGGAPILELQATPKPAPTGSYNILPEHPRYHLTIDTNNIPECRNYDRYNLIPLQLLTIISRNMRNPYLDKGGKEIQEGKPIPPGKMALKLDTAFSDGMGRFTYTYVFVGEFNPDSVVDTLEKFNEFAKVAVDVACDAREDLDEIIDGIMTPIPETDSNI